jgi:hypothetical protein
MYKAFLNRLHSSPHSTLGILTVYFGLTGVCKCCTLELPWKNNERKVSCIPAGGYVVGFRKATPHFKYPHYHVRDVEGRSGILIHRGNYTSDIEGCILVGTDWGDLNKDGKTDIKNSKIALDRLYEAIGEKEWLLSIT